MQLGHTLRNINRIREVIGILLKYGFQDLVTNTALKRFIPKKNKLNWKSNEDDRPILEHTRWERIRMATEELGPTFVKLAQVLSNRPDLVPDALIQELQQLQSNVAPFPSELARKIIENESGKTIDELFEWFQDKPIGSASIAQVHKAKLKNGPEVAVKVRRPGISKVVQKDLDIMRDLATMGENYLLKNGITNVMDVIDQFERTTQKELLLLTEARNIEQFRAHYKNYKDFYIPEPFKKLSTDRMLIMEFIAGCKIDDVDQIRAWGLKPEKMAEKGMSIYLTQIFEYGYFHADPHPGNVLVRKDGVICLLDYGMVGKLMKQDKYAFAGIFISMANMDARSMALNFKRLSLESNIPDEKAFEYDLADIIDDFANLDVEESNMAELSIRLQKVMYDYKLRVPGGVFLVLRALAILEGIGKSIHPTFNTMEFIKPYGRKLLEDQYSAKNIFDETVYRVSGIYSLLSNFPIELRQIMKRIKQGKLHFEIEHQGYQAFLEELDHIGNKFILTFLIGTLVIGSSISLLAEFTAETTHKYGMPLISVIGFATAGVLGIILFLKMLKN